MTATPDEEVVYLDHNATTPVAPEVLDAMLPYLTEHYGNASSDHALGRHALQAITEARGQVASLIGAEPGEIVFTSGGTESNNLAIRGTAATAAPGRHRIVATQVEHPATARPCAFLEEQGWAVSRVPVTGTGSVDPEAVLGELDLDVALLTVILAQNETGAIMPVGPAAAAARPMGIITHTDAAQAIGKIGVDVDSLGVDLLSIAGHKCYAPKGVGALYVRSGTPLRPVLLGAGQERGLRPGTENVAYIVGLGAACHLARSRMDTETPRLGQLREELWRALSDQIPGLERHTPGEPDSLPNTLMVSFPGVLGREVLRHAPRVAASTGSACHAGQDTPGGTLLAMGVPVGVALGAVRLSLGRGTTSANIATAAEALATAHRDASEERSP